LARDSSGLRSQSRWKKKPGAWGGEYSSEKKRSEVEKEKGANSKPGF